MKNLLSVFIFCVFFYGVQAQNSDKAVSGNDALKVNNASGNRVKGEAVESPDFASPSGGARVNRTNDVQGSGTDYKFMSADSLPPERKSKINANTVPKD